jgi:hypothetical protein
MHFDSLRPKVSQVNSALLKTVRDKYEIIKNWDMSHICEYLVINEGVTQEDAVAMELEYKRFLAISFVVTDERRYPISASVDPFWHSHIMHTHDYTKMCHTLGGQYIHHVPAVTAEARARLCDAYNENTIPLYREAFGEPDPKWWPQDASICVACCDRDQHADKDQLLLSV